MRGLDGKNVIVTGGGGAIGGAICRRFAGYGARVGVLDKNLDGAQRIVGEIRGSGGRAEAMAVDIADHAAVKKAVAAFQTAVGPTDILIHKAARDPFSNFLDTS